MFLSKETYEHSYSVIAQINARKTPEKRQTFK